MTPEPIPPRRPIPMPPPLPAHLPDKRRPNRVDHDRSDATIPLGIEDIIIEPGCAGAERAGAERAC